MRASALLLFFFFGGCVMPVVERRIMGVQLLVVEKEGE